MRFRSWHIDEEQANSPAHGCARIVVRCCGGWLSPNHVRRPASAQFSASRMETDFENSLCGGFVNRVRFQPFCGVGRDIFSFFSGLTEVLMWAFLGAFGVSLP
jgi:hypothetical protein